MAWYKLRVRSMTGHGLGSAERDGAQVEVELRSVNHRYLDLKLRTGGLEPAVEERIAGAIRARLSRGAVTATLRTRGGASARGIAVDVEVGERAFAELSRLASAIGAGSPSLELVCAQPGVVTPAEPARGDEALAACAENAAIRAADNLVTMRETEGKALADDLTARAERMRERVERLEERAAANPKAAATRLEARIEELLGSATVDADPARIAQEVAILADRIDVTEELVRARAHLDQVREALAETGPVGRRLDFLAQELGRELNTAASKAQSAEISGAVVDLKAELEKLREQVQNVE